MTSKAVVPRQAALRDVEDVIGWYLQEGALQAASGFIDALQRAYTLIGRQPASGSPRFAHELNIPGLRTWALTRYPHIVFYVEQADHVDVWRVLSSERDLPAWLSEPVDFP